MVTLGSTSRTGPVGVGIIGAGTISNEYLTNLTSFPDIAVLAVGDLFEDAAAAQARTYGVKTSGGADAVLSHPEVELVINLTIPAAHVEVATAAVRAGKHVWSEKPFSLDRAGGRALLKSAEAAGVRLGCAPDTFLGAGLQTARRIIDHGDIGTPLTALTLMQSPGPESWHPNPAFLFGEGAGPLFDIGPYYLTTLIQTFGSIARVAALGSQSRQQRIIGSGPNAGQSFDVTVPTHVSALAEFEAGQISNSIFSFDSPLPRTGFVEVTGSEATIAIPDPNAFVGDIRLRPLGSEDWTTIEAEGSNAGRGTGALEMARAIRAGTPHRAPGSLAYHVLDAMVSINESLQSREFVAVESSTSLVPALPADWDPRAATLA